MAGRLDGIPELPIALASSEGPYTFREITYRETNGVGWLTFEFMNGAMSHNQCRRLLDAYRYAVARPTKVIVLAGGREFWSNGMHLGVIEAAASPADASWDNINAIDDLAREVLLTTDKFVISALEGNAGAGGVFHALAADQVLMRDGMVLIRKRRFQATFLSLAAAGQAHGSRSSISMRPSPRKRIKPSQRDRA